jgi:S1/P1 Nuclease
MTTTCSDCKPLGEVSEWADDIRHQRSTTPLHNVALDCDLEYNNRTIAFDNSWTDGNNVIGNVVKYCTDLQEYAKRRRRGRKLFLIGLVDNILGAFDNAFGLDRDRESLMFLTHMMGDLHQPLPCGCDHDQIGLKVDVTFFNYFFNPESHPFPFICYIVPSFLQSILFCDLKLHNVWDDRIISKTLNDDFSGSRKDLENDIWYSYIEDNEDQRTEWLSCFPNTGPNTSVHLSRQHIEDCVLEWANESLQLALEYSYHDADGSVVVTGSHLIQAYYERSLPVVRMQLAAGAVRFAALLEHVLHDFESDADANTRPGA